MQEAERAALSAPTIAGGGAMLGDAVELLKVAEGRGLARHAAGDWGALDADDWEANEAALREGGGLFSVYETAGGCRFYVITESGRDLTTVLLPDDY